MPLSRDLREFVECLISNRPDIEQSRIPRRRRARRLLARISPVPRDIDFFVRPTSENAARVMSALRQFGFGELDISIRDLTSITGVGFDEAWETRVAGELDGLPVFFIGKAALLRNKESTGRGKDQIDAGQLRKLPPRE